MTQVNEQDDKFIDRMKEETLRTEAARRNRGNSMFVAVVDSSDADTPFTERHNYRRGPNTADSALRRDNIVDALKNGSAEVIDTAGNHVGWENARLDLLLDAECRRLLDILPYAPSREESLANIIRRECRNLSPEEQLKLASLDKNIDMNAIRPMLFGDRQAKTAVEQHVATVDETMETQEQPAIAQLKQASEPVSPYIKDPAAFDPPQQSAFPQQTSMSFQQTVRQPSAPLNLPFTPPAPKVPVMPEKTISLSCPIGRYKVPVLDVIQNTGYIVIIQREDASLLVSFESNNTVYRIDGIDANLEFSGIAFRFNGSVYTIMVTR